MKYIVKQKMFSIADKFTIQNERQEDCFQVRGKVFSLRGRLSFLDMAGAELLRIEKKLFRFLPEYVFYRDGTEVATVKKLFAFFRNKFAIRGTHGDFSIDGNAFAYDFQIRNESGVVAVISKKWFAWRDTYGVDIVADVDPAFILALVIVIDQVLHPRTKSSNSR